MSYISAKKLINIFLSKNLFVYLLLIFCNCFNALSCNNSFCDDAKIGDLIVKSAEKKVKIGGSEYQRTRPHEATQYISQYLISLYPPADSFIVQQQYSEKKIKEDQSILLKLNSLIHCSVNYIKRKTNIYNSELQIIEDAYDFFKKTVSDLRNKRQLSTLLYNQYIKNKNVYSAINTYLIQLINNIREIEPKFILSELKKEAGNKSLSKIFPNYELFFREYNDIKNKFENQTKTKITPYEILFLLNSIGVLKIDATKMKNIQELGTCDKDVDILISSFIDKLEKFSFQLNKAWFVSNKRTMQKNIFEMIDSLRTICPILLSREYSKIADLEDYAKAFIGDASFALFEWLRLLKNDLLRLQGK